MRVPGIQMISLHRDATQRWQVKSAEIPLKELSSVSSIAASYCGRIRLRLAGPAPVPPG